MLKRLIRSSLKSAGFDIKRYPDTDLLSKQLALKAFGINKILDVGANAGQFAQEIRNNGFTGELISFEPLSSAFALLKGNAASDSKWSVNNFAIGDTDGEITIHVAKNSFSSSIRDMLPAHIESAKESVYISEEKVKIARLDSIFKDYYKAGDNILLKIDTQGYEKNVLDGAMNSLPKIKGIKLEMSLVPLYSGEMLFWEMAPYIKSLGYTLYSIENSFSDPKSGKILQVDGVFYKEG